MLDHLAPGDVVTVTRIDRLARSTFDLFAIVKQIVDAEAQFRSLAEPWADIGTSSKRLASASKLARRSAVWPAATTCGVRIGTRPNLTPLASASAPAHARCALEMRRRSSFRRRQAARKKIPLLIREISSSLGICEIVGVRFRHGTAAGQQPSHDAYDPRGGGARNLGPPVCRSASRFASRYGESASFSP